MKKKIYALLVAINEYPLPQHRLKGCVNDANEVKEFLLNRCQNADTEVILKTLYDTEASRSNIIDGFVSHLGQATSEDVAFFYYCGHGGQEACPPEFWYLEPDHINQTIVCQDSRDPLKDGVYDIADKELGYLIYAASQNNPHFVAIMDCCHSGSGTRDVSENIKTRQVELSNKTRTIDSFIGYENYKKVGTDLKVPRGSHVLLAAALNVQTAKETKCNGVQHGVFTYSLLEVLKDSKEAISYNDLIRRIKTRISNRVSDQDPQIEVIIGENGGDNKDMLDTAFLGGVIANKQTYLLAKHDKKQDSWIIDAGAVHGIPKVKSDEKTLLAIFDWNVSEQDLADISKRIGTAEVTAVAAGLSKISFIAYEEKDENGQITNYLPTFQADSAQEYKVKIMSVAISPVKFLLEGDAAGTILLTETLAKNKKISSDYHFVFTNDSSEAEYKIIAENFLYKIRQIGDKRLIAKPRKAGASAYTRADDAISDLKTITDWSRYKALHNPDTSFKNDDVSLDIFDLDYKIESDDEGNTYVDHVKEIGLLEHSGKLRLEYKKAGDSWKPRAIYARVKNNSEVKLFVTLLDMKYDFGISNEGIAGIWLNPNEETWFYEKQVYLCELPDKYSEMGVTEVINTFKLIYSTNAFDTSIYNQKPLELPSLIDEPATSTRDVGKKPKTAAVDWATKELDVVVVRPQNVKNIKKDTEVSPIKGISVKTKANLNFKIQLTSDQMAERSSKRVLTPSMLRDLKGEQIKFADGYGQDPGLSVVELIGLDKNQAQQELSQNPLQISLGALAEKEAMLPIGRDGDIFFPAGFVSQKDGKTVANIDTLPEESEAGTRSLGGSLKLMFQKIKVDLIGGKGEFQFLQKVTVNDDGSINRIGDDEVSRVKAIRNDLMKPSCRNILLFIHGITGDTNDMPKSMVLGKYGNRNVLSQYDLVLTFDYENLNTTIQTTASQLKEMLLQIGLRAGHLKNLHIVSHSMGGLVSRYFIESPELKGREFVKHLVMLGTPNNGSPWSKLEDMVTMALTTVLSKVSLAAWAVAPLTFLINKIDKSLVTLDQLNPEHDFFKELNAFADPHIPYSIIAGNNTLIERLKDVSDSGMMKKMFNKVIKTKDVALQFLFKEPHDIAVSVQSITHPTLFKERADVHFSQVACDHMSYFVDPAGTAGLAKVLYERVLKA